MIKVSITLPNNTQITLESEEPRIIREIVGIVLRDLRREGTGPASSTGGGTPVASGAGSAVATAPAGTLFTLPPDDSASTPPSSEAGAVSTDQTQAQKTAGLSGGPDVQPATEPADKPKAVTMAEAKFIEFCQSANPMGDMRRVAVAAHGASKLLNKPSVDTQELSRLFQLVGWHPPHNLVQTLRNAARSKFRWMERIPGRSGHYSATELGRTIASGS